MTAGAEAMRLCGREMTLFCDALPGGQAFWGHIQPVSYSDTESLHIPAPPGGVKKAKFLLLAEPSAPFEGQAHVFVECRGLRYELLRADPMFAGSELSHWEGILRLICEVSADA